MDVVQSRVTGVLTMYRNAVTYMFYCIWWHGQARRAA